jgi:hypothetical protein
MNRQIVDLPWGRGWYDRANNWGCGDGVWVSGQDGQGDGGDALAVGWRVTPEAADIGVLTLLGSPP